MELRQIDRDLTEIVREARERFLEETKSNETKHRRVYQFDLHDLRVEAEKRHGYSIIDVVISADFLLKEGYLILEKRNHDHDFEEMDLLNYDDTKHVKYGLMLGKNGI